MDETAVQSAHTGFVPRVGGLAIYISILTLIPLLSFGFIPLSVLFGFKAWVAMTGIPGVDALLSFAPFAILFTIFATVGVVNAFNLIDGLNGLSGYVAISVSLSLSLIAVKVNDNQTVIFLALLISAVLGFMALNFPMGKIFLYY